MGKPVLRQPVCVQQLENTEHLETFNFHILRPTLRLKRVWSEIQNLIAKRLPQREIMGHDFDDAMVHWRLVGRNTSWVGQFSSQERNQEPRLILPGQANSHETLLKHSEQDVDFFFSSSPLHSALSSSSHSSLSSSASS